VVYHFHLVTANERIKQVRLHRKLTSAELAHKAGVSPAEISLIERQMRSPRTDTLQRIAAALEVSTSYLLSELNVDLPIEEALAKESLQIFLRDTEPDAKEARFLRELSEKPSAPQDALGWQNLVANLLVYRQSLQERAFPPNIAGRPK
jgi:transcriptional regulator with XRE-family HTH domain